MFLGNCHTGSVRVESGNLAAGAPPADCSEDTAENSCHDEV